MKFFRRSGEGLAINNKCNVPNLVIHPLPSGLPSQINKHSTHLATLRLDVHLSTQAALLHITYSWRTVCVWRKLSTRANKERYTVRFWPECAVICKCSICRLSSHLMRRIFCRTEDCGSGNKKKGRTCFKIQTDAVRHPGAFWNTASDSLWRCLFYFLTSPDQVITWLERKWSFWYLKTGRGRFSWFW